jgi:ABC-type multidrug transport system ATPase subunit
MSNLSYEVELRSKDSSSGSGRKQILKPGSFTGDFEGLTAIMGPSGAGKTSLLNILAGRVTPAKGSTIFLDHRPLQQNSDIQSLSAYVQQDDCMLATQTVRETVEVSFAALGGRGRKVKTASVGKKERGDNDQRRMNPNTPFP